MKFGIDITNSVINCDVIKRLREYGHSIVDCTKVEATSMGDSLLKRVLLANGTKVDIYILIREIEKDEDSIELFLGDKEKETNFLNLFYLQSHNTSWNEIQVYDGQSFYLTKNIKAPTIIINIPKNISKDSLLDFKNIITNTLLLMSFTATR